MSGFHRQIYIHFPSFIPPPEKLLKALLHSPD